MPDRPLPDAARGDGEEDRAAEGRERLSVESFPSSASAGKVVMIASGMTNVNKRRQAPLKIHIGQCANRRLH